MDIDFVHPQKHRPKIINWLAVNTVYAYLSRKDKKKKTFFNTSRPFWLEHSTTLRILVAASRADASCPLWSWEYQVTECAFPLYPQLSPFPESAKVLKNSPKRASCQARGPSPRRTALDYNGFPLTAVFLAPNIEQNWTFQAGKQCQMLRADVQRAKLL